MTLIDVRTPDRKALQQISYNLFDLLYSVRTYGNRLADVADDEYQDMLSRAQSILDEIKGFNELRKPFTENKKVITKPWEECPY